MVNKIIRYILYHYIFDGSFLMKMNVLWTLSLSLSLLSLSHSLSRFFGDENSRDTHFINHYWKMVSLELSFSSLLFYFPLSLSFYYTFSLSLYYTQSRSQLRVVQQSESKVAVCSNAEKRLFRGLDSQPEADLREYNVKWKERERESRTSSGKRERGRSHFMFYELLYSLLSFSPSLLFLSSAYFNCILFKYHKNVIKRTRE